MALEGKRALITGSSRGIGRGVALKLAEHGVAVVVHYHKDESAADTLAARPGSRRRLLALAGRRATGMGKLGATREGVVAAFAGWLLARSSPEASTLHGQEVADLSVSAYSQPVT